MAIVDNRAGFDDSGTLGAPRLNETRRRALKARLTSLTSASEAQSLKAAIAELKQEAHGNGLTDDIVDAELAAWRDERNG